MHIFTTCGILPSIYEPNWLPWKWNLVIVVLCNGLFFHWYEQLVYSYWWFWSSPFFPNPLPPPSHTHTCTHTHIHTHPHTPTHTHTHMHTNTHTLLYTHIQFHTDFEIYDQPLLWSLSTGRLWRRPWSTATLITLRYLIHCNLHSKKQIVVLANNLVTVVAWLSFPC